MLTDDIQVSLKDVVIFLCEWAPDCSTIAGQQEHRYYKASIVKALAEYLFKLKREQTMLRPVFPTNHQLHDTIVWDTETSQYYNKKTDIYLSDDDVAFHKLPVRFDPLRAKLDSDLAEVMEKKFPEMKDEIPPFTRTNEQAVKDWNEVVKVNTSTEKKDPIGPDTPYPKPDPAIYKGGAIVLLRRYELASSDLERENILSELADSDLAILEHIVYFALQRVPKE